MRLFIALMAFALPAFVQAQNIAVDEETVRTCFKNAPTGAQAPACAGQATRECQRDLPSTSTFALAACVGEEAIIWERLESEMLRDLSFALKKVEDTGIKNTTDRTDALQDSQQVYIKFWEAECRFRRSLYQGQEKSYEKASVGANCTLEFAARRSIQLRDLLRELE